MRAMELRQTGPLSPDSGPLQTVQRDRPEPGPGWLRIRVTACGVCHTELDQISGRLSGPLPVIPGHQITGSVDALGPEVDAPEPGTLVGVGWIGGACGECLRCDEGRENLCDGFRATGHDFDGGYAEYACVPAAFTIPLPAGLDPVSAAPLLCGGAIGYRALKLTGIADGQVLGLTGFGASNHQVLALARVLYPESPVYVWARNPDQRRQALEAGAAWAGDTHDQPPQPADAIIDTTPVWDPVLAALTHLAPGGHLVINAIRKEDGDRNLLAGLDYPSQLWREKRLSSVANITRADIRETLDLAVRHDLHPRITTYPLQDANRALRELAGGRIDGARVLVMAA